LRTNSVKENFEISISPLELVETIMADINFSSRKAFFLNTYICDPRPTFNVVDSFNVVDVITKSLTTLIRGEG